MPLPMHVVSWTPLSGGADREPDRGSIGGPDTGADRGPDSGAHRGAEIVIEFNIF